MLSEGMHLIFTAACMKAICTHIHKKAKAHSHTVSPHKTWHWKDGQKAVLYFFVLWWLNMSRHVIRTGVTETLLKWQEVWRKNTQYKWQWKQKLACLFLPNSMNLNFNQPTPECCSWLQSRQISSNVSAIVFYLLQSFNWNWTVRLKMSVDAPELHFISVFR